MTTDTGSTDSEVRRAAIDRIRKRREFAQHVIVYVIVNLVLTLIWLLTMPGGFYWPMFPALIWGIGIVFHALDVYSTVFSPEAPSEETIEREIARRPRR